MKDKKIWIIFIFALAVLAVFFYYSAPMRQHSLSPKKPGPQALPLNTAALEAQVAQLKDLIQAFVQLNRSLDASFQKEKKERLGLDKVMNEAAKQNKSLARRLAQVKTGLDLTGPLKQKINEIGASLAGAKVSAGKEKALLKQLQDIHKKLAAIDSQIPEFLKENKAYQRDAESLRGLLSEKEEAIASLNAQLAAQTQETQEAKKAFPALSDELKKAQEAYAAMERKSAELERRGNESAQHNSSLQKEIERLNKDLQESRVKLSQALKEKEAALSRNNEEIKKTRAAIQKQEELKTEREAARIERLRAEKEFARLEQRLAQLEEKKQSLRAELEKTKLALQDTQRQELLAEELKAEVSRLKGSYAGLTHEHTAALESIAQNEMELGRRSHQILTMEEKKFEAETRLSSLQLKTKEIEKASALLREHNVAVQLEREALQKELSQATLRLSELEQQASQISSILGAPKPQEALLSGGKTTEEAKRVELELYPLQNTGETGAEKPADIYTPPYETNTLQ